MTPSNTLTLAEQNTRLAAVESRASVVVAVLVAGFLGLFMLYGVGFAQAAHDSAHDSRHAFSFPCH